MGDEWAEELYRRYPEAITVGINKSESHLCASDISFGPEKVAFQVTKGKYSSFLEISPPSSFAVANTIVALEMATELGVEFGEILNPIQEKIEIEGRYNLRVLNNGVTVCIDFAHSPAALENLLSSIRDNPQYNSVITVFGCGGDRDKSKRPVMGRIADKYSDLIFITTDNPRTEQPRLICEEIISGIENGQKAAVIEDRPEAIRQAILSAQNRDIVIIAGKGNEKTQERNGCFIPMNDATIVDEVCSLFNL